MVSPSPSPSSPVPGDAHFTISDPYSTQTFAVRPAGFSSATADLHVTINGQSVEIALTPSSSQCTLASGVINCYADIPAPNGPITFTVKTLDANGNVLSTVTGTATIAGKTTVPLALQGIWKNALVRLQNENPVMGSPSTIPVTVTAYDAAGAIIVGPEPYTSPVPLYNTDTSGATSLSTNAVTAPGQAVTLSYNGTSYVNAQLSAGVPFSQTFGTGDTMMPALRTVEYPIPSGASTWESNLSGKMFENPNGSVSFAERTLTNTTSIGTVSMSGAVTESPTALFFEDIVPDAAGNIWGITNLGTLAQYTGAGAGFQSPALPGSLPGQLALGADGNFWMADGGAGIASIERVTPAGVATDFPLTGGNVALGGGVLAGDGNLWFEFETNLVTSQMNGLLSISPSGVITDYPLSIAQISCCANSGNVALGPDGALYFLYESDHVGRMTTSGAFSSFQIGMAVAPSVGGGAYPNALAFGPDGALWISTGNSNGCSRLVERVTTSGSYGYFVLPVTCGTNTVAADVGAFAKGSDGNLWYTRGNVVGKIIL